MGKIWTSGVGRGMSRFGSEWQAAQVPTSTGPARYGLARHSLACKAGMVRRGKGGTILEGHGLVYHGRQCGEGTIWKGGEGFGIAGGEWYGEGREEGRARRGLVTQGIAGTV